MRPAALRYLVDGRSSKGPNNPAPRATLFAAPPRPATPHSDVTIVLSTQLGAASSLTSPLRPVLLGLLGAEERHAARCSAATIKQHAVYAITAAPPEGGEERGTETGRFEM